MLQISGTVFVGGRADRDDLDFRVADRSFHLGGEVQAAFPHVPGDQFLQTRFPDGKHALVEPLDLRRVDVEAKDRVADLGQASAGDQSHVAGAENGKFHEVPDSRGNAPHILRQGCSLPIEPLVGRTTSRTS